MAAPTWLPSQIYPRVLIVFLSGKDKGSKKRGTIGHKLQAFKLQRSSTWGEADWLCLFLRECFEAVGFSASTVSMAYLLGKS